MWKGVITMNLALRKLAMLEKDMIAREEEAKINGYATCPVDADFKARVSALMDKVRVL